MSVLKQVLTVVVLTVLAGTAWIAFLPSAVPLLDRVGALEFLGVEATADDRSSNGGSYRQGPTRVVTEAVTRATLTDRATALGDGRAIRSVTLTSEVAGRLTRLGVESGAQVAEGELVAQLEARAERLALERAKAERADARETLDRLERLQETGAATEVDLQSAQLAARTAKVAVREARFALDQRRITAPIAGKLGILDIEAGDRVTPDTSIARIEDRSRILVEFRVPARLVSYIAPGDAVSAAPVAQPDTTLTGEVRAIDNRVDPATRTITVQAIFDNEAERLRGGMAFRVKLDFAGEHYPAVDPLAVQWGRDGAYVWRAAGGTAERVPVRIMQRGGDLVLVDGAIAPGEMVVTEGVQTLDPGDEIEVAAGPTAEADQAAPSDTASES